MSRLAQIGRITGGSLIGFSVVLALTSHHFGDSVALKDMPTQLFIAGYMVQGSCLLRSCHWCGPQSVASLQDQASSCSGLSLLVF